MEHITLLLAIVIVTALVFDFTNGFHDTANAMATTISTGALRPKTAGAINHNDGGRGVYFLDPSGHAMEII
ncbi:hypothetical protein ACWC5G_29950, partial [Streptomyces sp. NPDC001274]